MILLRRFLVFAIVTLLVRLCGQPPAGASRRTRGRVDGVGRHRRDAGLVQRRRRCPHLLSRGQRRRRRRGHRLRAGRDLPGSRQPRRRRLHADRTIDGSRAVPRLPRDGAGGRDARHVPRRQGRGDRGLELTDIAPPACRAPSPVSGCAPALRQAAVARPHAAGDHSSRSAASGSAAAGASWRHDRTAAASTAHQFRRSILVHVRAGTRSGSRDSPRRSSGSRSTVPRASTRARPPS